MTPVKVTRVSKDGFWLLLGNEGLQLPFTEFPWFKDATTAQLCDVKWLSPDHLYWPSLDVDLSVESIRHPERFPLVSRGRPHTSGDRETPP
jgi:hypothetical protein